eukprot:755974-Hanusia_phi.AAC.4
MISPSAENAERRARRRGMRGTGFVFCRVVGFRSEGYKDFTGSVWAQVSSRAASEELKGRVGITACFEH